MPTPRDETMTPPMQTQGTPRSLWRNRDYLLLWSGQAISSFGTQASQLAFPLLVLFLTGSPAQAGVIGAIRLLPYIFISLPGGVWVDRWDRKRIMIVCDSMRALTLGSIPLAYAWGHLTLAQLYLAALIEGTLYVFFNVAQTSCLPHVVSKEQLPAALGQNQAAESTSFLVGPSLGGALFGLSQMLPFLADAISYTVSVISLFLIRATCQEERKAARRKLRQEMAEGLGWLWKQPLLRFLALRACGVNFSYSGVTLVVIVLAQQEGASAVVIGLILAIAGVGSIFGSLLGPVLQKRFSFGAVMIGLTWLYLISWSLYLVAFTPLLLGVVTALLYINRPISNVFSVSYRLALTPDALRGRVNSATQMISWWSIPVGGALSGVLLQQTGTRPTILFFSLCFLIIGLATQFNPHVRHARPLAEIKAE